MKPLYKLNKVTDNNENYPGSDSRFANAVDLWDRYSDTKSSSKETLAEAGKIINMYQRKPYLKKINGKRIDEPNWGKFRAATDDYIKFFSALALDREIWCRVETYEGEMEEQSCYYSDTITSAFHKFCIKPWHEKEAEVIKCISDDCLFNRGAMIWENPIDTYPSHVPSEDVMPDTNATTNPKSFDILFVRWRYTAIELYDIATSNRPEDLGWNKAAIIKALRNQLSCLKSTPEDSVTEKFRRGGVPQSQRDQLINVVFCYFKEYKKKKKGGRDNLRISRMIIPEDLIAMGITEHTAPSNRFAEAMCYVDYEYSCFTEVISMWTSNIERAFYSKESFAWQIYLGCKFYDNTMNSIIRGFRRSMRLYLKTSNESTRKKILAQDAEAEVVTFGADDDIAQFNVRQDMSAGGELLRNVTNSISSFSPNDFQGTQSSPKGYPITKGEAQILAAELDDSKAVSIKLFISANRMFVNELYRRFVSSTSGCDTHKNFQRFKKYLKSKDIPDSAWKFDEVEVYPRFNQFAGKASTNYATAKGLLEAAQIKPASKAEEKAKRDVIAALIGESNVYDYMDLGVQIENEIMIVGQENEALDNPAANPANIPVTPTDNHMLHIMGHLQDYVYKMNAASQLLKNAGTLSSPRKIILVEKAAEMINAQDAKGGHIEAHLQMLATDETKADELKEFMGQFNAARIQQDQLANMIAQYQQSMEQDQSTMIAQDMDLQHKARMNELDYNHTKAMNNLGLEKAGSQAIARQEATKANQELKAQGKAEDMSAKREAQNQEIEHQRQKGSIELQKEQVKLAATKASSKAKENESSQTAKKKPSAAKS